jgi:hypothetical protein
LVAGLALVAAAVAFVGSLVPSLPLAVLIAGPAAIALGLGIVGPYVVKRSLEPATAVAMRSFSGNSTTLVCLDATFATRLAEANGVAVRPAKWSEGFVVSSALVVLLVGGVVAIYVGVSSNPPVHFDNATDRPVKFWLDGEPLVTITPQMGAADRPSVRIPYGTHVIGWSRQNDSAPKEKTEVRVEWGADHLVNPERAGCYFLLATAYGTATTEDLDRGPLPIEAFYAFRQSIDNWFKGNPSSVSSKASGETRVAILPWMSCVELTKAGCDLAVRKKAVECARSAWAKGDDAGMHACMAKARAKCGTGSDDDE